MVQARARAQWKKLGTYQLIGHSQSMPAPSMHLKGQSKLPIRTYVRSIDAVHAVPAAARAIRHRSTVTYVLLAGVLHHALLLHVRLARIYSGTFSRWYCSVTFLTVRLWSLYYRARRGIGERWRLTLWARGLRWYLSIFLLTLKNAVIN